jgi:ATP-binding cassette, subfamily C, bacterial CydD
VLELAATLGIALVAVTVCVRLVGGEIAFEPALIVLVLTPELYLPLRNLGAHYHASADGVAVADRLLELVDVPSASASGGVPPPSPRDVPVRLEGVSFAYSARPTTVLDAVDLELEPGETVALVGPSGGGKSTVASLILRLAQPLRGRVTAGSVDLADCAPDAWRAQLAWLPQRPTLFRGTIADNIRLGDAAADRARVRTAAELAGADSFIRELADGYRTLVGDGGRPLSAGQRQRIALARAFLREAPLVILDEPTANLDPLSAELVEDAVERLSDGRTVLLIAHRPELAARADRVVLLEAGRIVEPRAAAA